MSATDLGPSERQGTDFWISIIQQAKALGVLRLTLTGGEPFVREDIGDILRELRDRRIGLTILTNGTRIREDHLPLLRESGAVLSISIDAPSASAHDAFRKDPGGFVTALDTMKALKRVDVPFVISCVIHDQNVDEVEQVLDLGRDVGAMRVIVVPMVRVGRGAARRSEPWLPRNHSLTQAIERVRKVATGTYGPDIIVGNGDSKEITAFRERYSGATAMSKRNPGLCKAGVFSMAINEDGLAYSCLRGVQTKTYPVADLTQSTLLDAWEALSWTPFLDVTTPIVPCRVEAIQREERLKRTRLPVVN